MAIIPRNRTSVNKNPIDLPENSKTAVGVTLPFDGYAVFNQSFTTKEQIKSNLINLMLTSPGERLMNPSFGIGIRDLLFEQMIDKEVLKNQIMDSAAVYIPEISIEDIGIARVDENTNPETYQLQIGIFYSLLANYEQDAVELNFY